jgi:hypothetical protein
MIDLTKIAKLISDIMYTVALILGIVAYLDNDIGLVCSAIICVLGGWIFRRECND